MPSQRVSQLFGPIILAHKAQQEKQQHCMNELLTASSEASVETSSNALEHCVAVDRSGLLLRQAYHLYHAACLCLNICVDECPLHALGTMVVHARACVQHADQMIA
jgi:hypothetical protein